MFRKSKLRLGHSCRRATRRKIRACHARLTHACTANTIAPSTTSAVNSKRFWQHEHWVLGATGMVVTLLCGLALPAWADALRHDHDPQIHIAEVDLDLPSHANNDAASNDKSSEWKTVTVASGQTMSDIFSNQNIGYSVLQKFLQASEHDKALEQPHPGDEFKFRKNAQGELSALRYERDETHQITLELDADGNITQHVTMHELEHRQQVAFGTISTSLFAAAQEAGLNSATITRLAEVFKYDIDFIKDIAKGDRFTVVYDTIYREGEFLKAGDILAAEFYNRDKRHTAYAFADKDGELAYYSEEGRPLRKSLMRTPVKFTRISSRFSDGRKHPILGYTRAHKGVDYAAPAGTAIHAAGDGVIVQHGWANGYGRFIEIKHNGQYTTAYGHMSAFAKGLNKGSRVKQGQVIAYVGQTGLATGPHLHYEVRVNGKQVNPLEMTLPKPEPMPGKLLAQFKLETRGYATLLERLDNNYQLANQAQQHNDDAI